MTRLALFLALVPVRALADVCALERPDWRPENGPATALDELAFLFTSLPGLGIIGALTLAALTGQKRYFAISTVFAALVGAATGSMAVMVADVDEHHRRAAALGADVVYPPVDQPYGYREYSARDSEGQLWSFMAPLT